MDKNQLDIWHTEILLMKDHNKRCIEALRHAQAVCLHNIGWRCFIGWQQRAEYVALEELDE